MQFESFQKVKDRYPDIDELNHLVRLFEVTNFALIYENEVKRRGYIFDKNQLTAVRSLAYESCLIYGRVKRKFEELIPENKKTDWEYETEIDLLYVEFAFLFERRVKLRSTLNLMPVDKRPNGKPVRAYRGRAYHGLLPLTQYNTFGSEAFALSIFSGSDKEFEEFWEDKNFGVPELILGEVLEYLDVFKNDDEDYKDSQFILELEKMRTTLINLDVFEEIVISTIEDIVSRYIDY